MGGITDEIENVKYQTVHGGTEKPERIAVQ
jgi:hypothetical protein